MKQPIEMNINGEPHTTIIDTRTTLLDSLRYKLGFMGPKEGCGNGNCGACTVLVNGRTVNSCCMLVAEAQGMELVTVEGLARDGKLDPLQQAFIDHDGFQCGFCTPGQIMSAVALIAEGEAGADPERIREGLSGNLCRCGAHAGIVEAVLAARTRMDAKSSDEEAAA